MANGQHVILTTTSKYPFEDTATITIQVNGQIQHQSQAVTLKIRIPCWSQSATINETPVKNCTTFSVVLSDALSSTTTFHVVLKPELIAERGWGELGVLAGSPITYASSTDGKDISIPTDQYEQDLALSGGASILTSRQAGHMDIRTGSPNSISKVAIMHPIGGTDQHGNGHYISDISFTFKYVAGYTPAAGQLKKGSQLSLLLVDAKNESQVNTVLWTSEPLDKYSFDKYQGYSPPMQVHVTNLHLQDGGPRQLLVLHCSNNDRNLQIQLDQVHGLNVTIGWIKSKTYPAGKNKEWS